MPPSRFVPAPPAPPPDPSARVELAEIGLPPEIEAAVRSHGVTALYPPQAAALKPALQGRSVLLACPTASGKSLVAYLTLIRAALAGRTGLYLVPLRALAHEPLQQRDDVPTETPDQARARHIQEIPNPRKTERKTGIA